jgi:hypothetical protein
LALDRDAIENGAVQVAKLVSLAMHIADCEIDRSGHPNSLPHTAGMARLMDYCK